MFLILVCIVISVLQEANNVKKLYKQAGGGGQKLNRLKRKSFGVIAIEVCFTLPVVVYLIFFTIELIKINITQDALQSICEEATYLTIAHDYESGADLIKKIDAIVEKYRPVFIPEKAICSAYGNTAYPVIRWHYETYENLNEMLKNQPYGGSCVFYSRYEAESIYVKLHSSPYYIAGISQFLPVGGKEILANPINHVSTASYMNTSGLPANRVFIFTVSCNYLFSNAMVKHLFNGGVNSRICSNDSGYNGPANGANGTLYLLWARGAGIVNVK